MVIGLDGESLCGVVNEWSTSLLLRMTGGMGGRKVWKEIGSELDTFFLNSFLLPSPPLSSIPFSL